MRGAAGRPVKYGWPGAVGAVFSVLVLMMTWLSTISPPALASSAPGTRATAGWRAEEHGGTFKDGGVITRGDASFFGSPTNLVLAAPVVAMAAAPERAIGSSARTGAC